MYEFWSKYHLPIGNSNLLKNHSETSYLLNKLDILFEMPVYDTIAVCCANCNFCARWLPPVLLFAWRLTLRKEDSDECLKVKLCKIPVLPNSNNRFPSRQSTSTFLPKCVSVCVCVYGSGKHCLEKFFTSAQLNECSVSYLEINWNTSSCLVFLQP